MPIGGRWASEAILAVVAGAAFLGFLGSTELWGKREQRASAEAIDTVDRGHWLVAEIQGRPRLEKPPLPRWIASALILATGRRDEAIVRLPNALAALATIGLVYALGRSIGGRSVGLASAFALASSAYFVVEMRQAGNDGLLTLFATLALFSARKRLHGDGGRGWNLAFALALGLGFLTKGPMVVLLAGVAIVGDLAIAGRVRSGLRLLVDARGVAIFAALALAWPVPVLFRDPTAARVWWLEMGQKTGAAGIVHGNGRGSIALDWPWMTLPWTPLALLAALRPLRRIRGEDDGAGGLALAWWWAMGNLAALGLWSVAKPNYYLPCLPAVALLVGSEWVRLARLARTMAAGSSTARGLIQAGWVAAFVAAVLGPVAAAEVAPGVARWAALGGAALAASVVAGAWAWRRGFDGQALAWPASGLVAVALIGYGAIAPGENPGRGHKALAAELGRRIPATVPTVWFFDELDEGLWFYLRGHAITPIPAGRGRYNRGFDLRDAAKGRHDLTPASRVAEARDRLADWARHADPASPYVLIRARVYDLPGFADGLGPLVAPVYREAGVKRNEMVLLRARLEVASGEPDPRR